MSISDARGTCCCTRWQPSTASLIELRESLHRNRTLSTSSRCFQAMLLYSMVQTLLARAFCCSRWFLSSTYIWPRLTCHVLGFKIGASTFVGIICLCQFEIALPSGDYKKSFVHMHSSQPLGHGRELLSAGAWDNITFPVNRVLVFYYAAVEGHTSCTCDQLKRERQGQSGEYGM